ncbi:MAG TPA: hypothetical protein VK040_01625 [Balneolaceae bacterium]|nr:hypothetical protein [Balneolaceae bacterium]
MAQLSRKALFNLTAASTSMMLVESLRLIRNYRYYNNIPGNSITRASLLEQIRYIQSLAYTLHNLMEKEDEEEAPFYVSIAGTINDAFEEVHRNVLFYEPDEIIPIIPEIDEQRRFWSGFCDTGFYNDDLVQKLEDTIPDKLRSLEKGLEKLPLNPSMRR